MKRACTGPKAFHSLNLLVYTRNKGRNLGDTRSGVIQTCLRRSSATTMGYPVGIAEVVILYLLHPAAVNSNRAGKLWVVLGFSDRCHGDLSEKYLLQWVFMVSDRLRVMLMFRQGPLFISKNNECLFKWFGRNKHGYTGKFVVTRRGRA